MKWINIASLLVLLAIAAGSLFYFWETRPSGKGKLVHNEERGFKASLENARMESYLKNYPEAEAAFRRLLTTHPDDTDIKVELASILYYQGRTAEALDLLKTIPAKDLNDKVYLLKADIYASMSDFPKAEELYRNYLKQVPTNQIIRLKLANLLSWEEKLDESAALFRQLLIDNPNDIQIRRHYARVLMWMGKNQEAADEIKKTLSKE